MKAVAKEWKDIGADVKESLEKERKLECVKYEQELRLWKERIINEGQMNIHSKDIMQPQNKIKHKM